MTATDFEEIPVSFNGKLQYKRLFPKTWTEEKIINYLKEDPEFQVSIFRKYNTNESILEKLKFVVISHKSINIIAY